MAEKTLEELKQALQTREDADAFREALERCPDLVNKEAPLERYLRSTDNNVEESARKIGNYWKLRKEVFGERWSFPLTLTPGHSALTDIAIQCVEKGLR